jgi:hypothetical protein
VARRRGTRVPGIPRRRGGDGSPETRCVPTRHDGVWATATPKPEQPHPPIPAVGAPVATYFTGNPVCCRRARNAQPTISPPHGPIFDGVAVLPSDFTGNPVCCRRGPPQLRLEIACEGPSHTVSRRFGVSPETWCAPGRGVTVAALGRVVSPETRCVAAPARRRRSRARFNQHAGGFPADCWLIAVLAVRRARPDSPVAPPRRDEQWTHRHPVQAAGARHSSGLTGALYSDLIVSPSRHCQ